MNKITFVFLSFFITSILYSQQLDWAKRIGGAGTDIATSIYVDEEGNSYVSGIFFDDIDLSPDTAIQQMLPHNGNSANEDFFIAKYDTAAALLWYKGFTGTEKKSGIEIVGDGESIYIAGEFSGSVDFNPGAGDSTLNSDWMLDAFLLKLSKDGEFEWVRKFHGKYMEGAPAVHISPTGNVIIAGYFMREMDLDPGITSDSVKLNHNRGAFVSILDPNGNYLHGMGINAHGFEDVVTDTAGNIYLAGEFKDTVDFDPGPLVEDRIGVSPLFNFYVLKLTDTATFQWVKTFGAKIKPDYRSNSCIAVDHDQNVYTGGWYGETVDFDPGPGVVNRTAVGNSWDAFSLVLDRHGNYKRVQTFGTNFHEQVRCVRVDSAGNTYNFGVLDKKLDLDPGPDTVFVNPGTGGRGAFIQKLDASGRLIWAKALQVANSNSSLNFIGTTLDPDGSIYATGLFEGTVDADPDTGIFNLEGNGSYDIFILKWGFEPTELSQVEVKQEIAALYPNPSTGLFNIKSKTEFTKAKVISTGGKVIREIAMKKDQSQIDLSGVAAGTYLLMLESEEGIEVLRVSLL